VDWGISKKRKLYLSTWYLENSTYGGAGDPSSATKEFGEIIHTMTVDGLCEVIEEFYKTQNRLKNRRLNRECKKF